MTTLFLALKAGTNEIHGSGITAEAAIKDALIAQQATEFDVAPASDRFKACEDFDYNPTEAIIVDGVADLITPRDIKYYNEVVVNGGVKITHVAMFANPADRIAIQAIGSSAEEAIGFAVKATGAETDAFVAIPVTPRMSALLASGEVPTNWVDRADGAIDCEVDYAVFAERETDFDEDAPVVTFINLHGEDIEADSAREAVIDDLDDLGLDRAGEYVVVSYPRDLSFGELFEQYAPTKFRIRDEVDARLITVEKVDLDTD